MLIPVKADRDRWRSAGLINPRKEEMALNARQQLFVKEYLKDLNATAAAKRAGYSEKTAYSIGQENLNKPEIAEAVAVAFAARSERTEIDADWVLTRLAEEATADAADLYEENGTLKPIQDWPGVWRTGLVAGLDTVQEYETVDGKKERVGCVTKIKLSDRIKRIELIGKHIGVQAFSEKHQLEHGVSDAMKEILNGCKGTTRSLPSDVDEPEVETK